MRNLARDFNEFRCEIYFGDFQANEGVMMGYCTEVEAFAVITEIRFSLIH